MVQQGKDEQPSVELEVLEVSQDGKVWGQRDLDVELMGVGGCEHPCP